MSAPDTNPSTEKKRHRPALRGIWGVLIFVAVLTLGYLAIGSGGEDTDTSAAPAAEASGG